MSEVKEWWVCSICGPATWSSANWCDGGCGSDYNKMTKLVLPHELIAQLREKVEWILTEDIIAEIYGIHDSSKKSCAGCDALPALDLLHSRVLSLLTEIEGEMK